MTEVAAELTTEQLRSALASVLRPALGDIDVRRLARLKGGYSREMWSFDAVDRRGTSTPLILCADSAAGVVGTDAQALDRVREAALLRALHELDLPVPATYAAEDASGPLGRGFFVMERLPGTAAIGAFRRDPWYLERLDLLGQELADILASIHGAHVDDSVLGPRPAPADVAPQEVARWSNELTATAEARTPALDRALRWLATERPPVPERLVVVHGDFRIGNILHGRDDGAGRDGLRTVLDWEMAHFGDPLEDVAWAQLVCWRFGTGRVGGLVPLDRWAELYERAAGTPVDRAGLRFWEVLGSVKMACLVWRAAQTVTDPAERTLLERLFVDLNEELDLRLLPP